MVAAVTVVDNIPEMAYVGEKPWHGLGNQLSKGASIDTWTKEAGMLWTIERTPQQYAVAGKLYQDESEHVLYRSDNPAAKLATVSDGYKIVQPAEVVEFFRDLCEHNGFEMETAGTLFGGRKFWALANIGAESYVLNKSDKIKGRLLLATSCDGSMKTTARFVGERVVCSNTLTMALRERGGSKVTVSHRSEFSATNVKQDLGVGVTDFPKFMSQMRELAKIKLPREQAVEMTAEVLRKPSIQITEEQRQALRESRPAGEILRLFDGAAIGYDYAKATAYGWINAVTEYVDHSSPTRNTENRFNKSMFGKHEALKNRAFDMAMDLIK